MTPKFHYSLHFPSFIRKHGWIANCFVLERKHKLPKRFENNMCTGHASLERSALREVTKWHISTLVHGPGHFARGAGLVDPRVAKPQFANVLQHIAGLQHAEACQTAQTARISEWESVSRGDAVIAKCSDGSAVVGFVEFHGCVTAAGVSSCVSCIKLLQFDSEQGRKLRWTRTDRSVAVPTAQIQSALVWAEVGDGKVWTIKPIE